MADTESTTDYAAAFAPKIMKLADVAAVTGMSYENVKAATRRAVDPLPSIVCGKGVGKRVVRKVIVEEIGPWMKAEAERQKRKV